MAEQAAGDYEKFFSNPNSVITIEQVEETMQKIMDTYAGGIASSYQFNETGLALAKEKITALFPVLLGLHAEDMDDLLQIYEIRERLTVCLSLIAHLAARKETRWHSFAENMNYREESDAFAKYVNSVKEDGEIHMIFRGLVTDDYEPLKFRFDENNRVICEGGKKE
jgi:adenylylsulfate reductase subunit A